MTIESDEIRLWLVERTFTDRDLIVLVYATPDGERSLQKELASSAMHQRGTTVTAAIEADPADLDRVEDPETRRRYAAEAERMTDSYEPDEPV